MIEIAAMKKNPGRIESIAVTAVKEAILNAGNFDPVFNERDTLPSWDGSIYVYKGSTQSKKGLIEVIPVQIKGTTQDKRKCDKFNYSVEVSDLKNYLNCKSGSVLYFVVFIEEGEEELKKTIYYLKLLPFDLKKILAVCVNQESITLDFLPFPVEKHEIACLIYDITSDMQKQKACIYAEDVTIESLFRESNMPTLTLSRTFAHGENVATPFALIGHDFYFYAKRQDNVEQPTMHGRIDGIGFTIPCPVLVNGVQYYSEVERFEHVDKTVIKLGKGITLTYCKDGEHKSSLGINLSGWLKEDIRDLSFLLALHEFKQVQIGNETEAKPFDIGEGDIDFAVLEEQLEVSKQIQLLLDMLGVDGKLDLNCEAMTDEMWAELTKIAEFMMSERRVVIEENLSFALICSDIANLRILLVAIPEEGEKVYRVRKYGEVKNGIRMVDDRGEVVETTEFVYLQESHILNASNINYDALFVQLDAIPLSSVHLYLLTQLMMRMLLAYDKSNDERKDILNAALRLSEWLAEHDSLADASFKILNRFDALKRIHVLSDSEKEELYGIVENPRLAPLYRASAYLLLDNQGGAERMYKQLTEAEKSELRRRPVFRFWQGK
ncbi:MAG: DUF4365 domain-containing protein [Akkermansia sp.]|nr:DUF4365 domain-containing protein [Akkermansia sp.]